jgi:hypothetical protein
MPIEIRELVIKATVTQEAGSSTATNGAAPASNNAVTPAEELINACVDKILDILKNRHER